MKTALMIVDVQNDFIEGGALGVTGGRKVSEGVAKLVSEGVGFDLIVTTQDWHINPGSHWSDEPDYVDSWPVHCGANTFGSELHSKLQLALSDSGVPVIQIVKGEFEAAYSGFEGRNKDGSEGTVTEILNGLGVTDLVVVGIATDHCVKATALDAVGNSFGVTVLVNYIAGVNAVRSVEALETLKAAGVRVE